MLNRATGEIFTGDGVNGDIPVAYIAQSRRATSSRGCTASAAAMRGNVPAGAIATLVTPVPGIDPNAVGNLLAAHSGRDEETLDAGEEAGSGHAAQPRAAR